MQWGRMPCHPWKLSLTNTQSQSFTEGNALAQMSGVFLHIWDLPVALEACQGPQPWGVHQQWKYLVQTLSMMWQPTNTVAISPGLKPWKIRKESESCKPQLRFFRSLCSRVHVQGLKLGVVEAIRWSLKCCCMEGLLILKRLSVVFMKVESLRT